MDTYCVGRKHYEAELVHAICDEYKSGMSLYVLSRKHHIASKTLIKIFNRENIKVRGVKDGISVSLPHKTANNLRRKLDPQARLEFCNEYLSGDISVASLSAKFSIGSSTARKILKQQEGIFRPPSYLSYVFDAGFFKVIDTADKAYWYGFIVADGCVMLGKSPGLRIGLKGSDSEHLESFKSCINSNHPVRHFSKTYKHRGAVKSALACSIDIRSQGIADDLIALGCIPNKTNISAPIHPVDVDLFCHFARGVFDGDGCVTFSRRKNRGGYVDPAWSCVGNFTTLEYLRNGIRLALGIDVSELKFMRGCWFLRISGVHKVSALFRFLYPNQCTHLPRKRVKWQMGMGLPLDAN